MHEDRPITQRDPRFGGNMERANVGAQYAGASRDFYGGPSRGSPMLDQRYENYQAPHRVDYTSPRQTGTPNFGGPMPGKSTYTGGYDFNPRPNLKGRFQEPGFHRFPQSGPAGAPVEGPWNREYDDPMMRGLGGLQEQAAVDPSDWRTILKILEAGGDPGTETQTASNFSQGNLMDTNGAINLFNDMYNDAILDGNQQEADYYLLSIQDLMGTLPRAARGGLMSLRR